MESSKIDGPREGSKRSKESVNELVLERDTLRRQSSAFAIVVQSQRMLLVRLSRRLSTLRKEKNVLLLNQQTWYKSWCRAKDESVELRKVLRKEKEQQLCVLCKVEEATHIMLPCAHLCACHTCSGRLVATWSWSAAPCPMCRKHVRTVRKVFQG